MNDEQLKEDVRAAHAVFDLCNVRKFNRSVPPRPLSLRMRALMLSEAAGFNLTPEMLDAKLAEKSSDSN